MDKREEADVPFMQDTPEQPPPPYPSQPYPQPPYQPQAYPQPYGQQVQQPYPHPQYPYPQPQYPQQLPYPQQPHAGNQQVSYPQQQYTGSGVAASTTNIIVPPKRQRTGPIVFENYNSTVSMRLGLIQITLSFLSIIFNSFGIWVQPQREEMKRNFMFYIGTGIWAPLIFFFLSGGFAVSAAKHRTMCKIVTNMVLSIMATLAAFCLLGTFIASVGIDGSPYCREFSYICHGTRITSAYDKASLALGILMIFISLVMIVCIIYSAVLCCRAVCCGSMPQQEVSVPEQVQYIHHPAPGNPQATSLPQTKESGAHQSLQQRPQSHNPDY